MIAVCLIRQDPHYRRQAFEGGLRRSGYRLVTGGRPSGRQDLLVIWNRYGTFEQQANNWERDGGTVLVAENGYFGVTDAEGRQHYALAAAGHNGSGWVAPVASGRFDRLAIDVKPWREGGELVLVRGQRGIGTRLMASPGGWHQNTGAALGRRQKMPVLIRDHPGRHAPTTPIEHDLARAAGCVIWASAVGVKALVAGVPVWFDAPCWIGQRGARRLADDPTLANPMRDDAARLVALEDAAQGQWSVAELESGEPFAAYRDELAARAAA